MRYQLPPNFLSSQLFLRMVKESQMASVEGAAVVVVDLADQVAAREATALEGEEEGDGGEEGEGEIETTQKTEEEENSSLEEVAAVAGEGGGEVVNALTMGTVRREGEEGEEEGTTLSQAEETKKVKER